MKSSPLADQVRPKAISEFVGQEHLMGEGKPFRAMIEMKKIPSSIILWGPPGCGKTTVARLIANLTGSEFVELSAVNSAKKDMQAVVNKSRLYASPIVLFLDEIHRFNKAQQDYLLPYVEMGIIRLIGATTENPSFEVISALLSRSRVFVLNALDSEDIDKVLVNALNNSLFENVVISGEDRKLIAGLANGDARSALNILELSRYLAKSGDPLVIGKEDIENAAQNTHLRYDKDGEEHYNIISALHKSMRDSDVDASVYWTMRMIEGGEDPKYIIRRMIRFASEDIGNADPQALIVANSGKEAVEFLGYPECDTALVQVAIYLARAPKSNENYKAVLSAREDIKKTGNLGVPLHLRNAPTKLMKEIGYGKGYKYAHDYEDAKVEQEHMPDELKGRKYV